MSEDNVRFSLTQLAYDHMYKVATNEFVSYEDCILADRLWQISRHPYVYLERVKIGPPSLMREYNMLLKDGYTTHYTDEFADFMEKQFKSEVTLVPTMPAVELTEAGVRKKKEMESNPTVPPDPWGSWLYKLEEDEYEVPPWIVRGLEKQGLVKIVSKPIDQMQRDEEWESQLY